METKTLEYAHGPENNDGSNDNYIANLEDFNNQCRMVLEQLLTGRRMNVRDSLVHLGIGHLPRRIADLRDRGIPINDEFPKNPDGSKNRFKEYWLDRDFINMYLSQLDISAKGHISTT